MANIVVNTLTFKGPKKRVEELLAFVKSDESDFDFNKIISMPASLDIEESTRTYEALWLYIMTANHDIPEISGLERCTQEEVAALTKEVGEQTYDESRVSNFLKSKNEEQIREMLNLGRAAAENIIQHGHMSWYGWSNEHWGVKWNASEVSVWANQATFQTPWGSPVQVIERLSELFPDIEIDCVADIEGWGVFHSVYVGGALILEEELGGEFGENGEYGEGTEGFADDTENDVYDREESSWGDLENSIPFDATDVEVKGRTFVLTGRFERFEEAASYNRDSSREKIAELIQEAGGVCRSAVSKRTDYLVFGNLGDYGEKKCRMARLQREIGYEVKLIREDDLFAALEICGGTQGK